MISGGQFSVFRCLWGVGQATFYAFSPTGWGSLQALIYLSLAIGYRLKLSTATLLGLLLFCSIPSPSFSQQLNQGLEALLLLALFFSPPQPYLSYPYQLSKHSVWSLSPWQHFFYSCLGYLPFILCFFNYFLLSYPFLFLTVFLPLYTISTSRVLYPLWIFWMIGLWISPELWRSEMALLVFFLAKPLSSVKNLQVFYDGNCGLCHRAVIFLMQESPWGSVRFYPLQGKTFQEIASHLPYPLPDSLAIKTQGRVFFKAQALLKIANLSGGVWQALSYVLSWMPLKFLNLLYDSIASSRHRFFSSPQKSCPLFPPRLRHLFPELNSSPK